MEITITKSYLDFWEKHCNFTSNTIIGTKVALKKFEVFLIEKLGFQLDKQVNFDQFFYDEELNLYEGIDSSIIDKFIVYLRFEQKSSHYILYNSIVYLKSFFKFLKATKKIQINPMFNYKNPYYKREIKNRWLFKEDCKLILDYCCSYESSEEDYVMFLMLMTTGIRSSELCHLSREDIDFDNSIIHVEKGQKTRVGVVYMPEALVMALKQYTTQPEFLQRMESGNTSLFVHSLNMAHSKGSLRYKIRKIARAAGVTRYVNVHTFRYTTAKLMLDSGVNIVVIQKQLRHKDLATTLRYLGISEEGKDLVESLAGLNGSEMDEKYDSD